MSRTAGLCIELSSTATDGGMAFTGPAAGKAGRERSWGAGLPAGVLSADLKALLALPKSDSVSDGPMPASSTAGPTFHIYTPTVRSDSSRCAHWIMAHEGHTLGSQQRSAELLLLMGMQLHSTMGNSTICSIAYHSGGFRRRRWVDGC